jgi:hypothetical protein
LFSLSKPRAKVDNLAAAKFKFSSPSFLKSLADTGLLRFRNCAARFVAFVASRSSLCRAAIFALRRSAEFADSTVREMATFLKGDVGIRRR